MAISLEPGARAQPLASPAPDATCRGAERDGNAASADHRVGAGEPDGHDATTGRFSRPTLAPFGCSRSSGSKTWSAPSSTASSPRTTAPRSWQRVDSVCKGGRRPSHLPRRERRVRRAGRRDARGAAAPRRGRHRRCASAPPGKSPTRLPPRSPPGRRRAPALEQALEEAKTALASMTRTREAERLAVGDALLQTRQRMQAALADAEERHAQAAMQWAGRTRRAPVRAARRRATPRAPALPS